MVDQESLEASSSIWRRRLDGRGSLAGAVDRGGCNGEGFNELASRNLALFELVEHLSNKSFHGVLLNPRRKRSCRCRKFEGRIQTDPIRDSCRRPDEVRRPAPDA